MRVSRRGSVAVVVGLVAISSACDASSNDESSGRSPASESGDDSAVSEPVGPDTAVASLAAAPLERITICHRTNGSSPWVEITISESAVDAHQNHPWGADIIPAPPEGCPQEPESTAIPPESTTAPPESTTIPPESTTAPPESTSIPPESTSIPPESTTAPPESTTIPPESTSIPPNPTTAPPTGVLPSSSVVPPSPTTAPPTGLLPSSTEVSPATAGPPSRDLPGTGNPTNPWLSLAAALLVLLGVGMVVIVRRPGA